jgi:Hint domain
MTESASATISATQLDATHWQYSLSLTDTGTTTIGTFWFAWVPGENFLTTPPSSVSNPAGWQDQVTTDFPGDGFGVQWTASLPSNALQPGDTLTGFSFTSTDAPSAVIGTSAVHPTFSVETAFIYSGAPFSDPGVQITAEAACFLPGTYIMTPQGEVLVERLCVGDVVSTLSGGTRRICWIGQGRTLATRGRRSAATPVIIRKGALDHNVPHQDLRVTKGHSLFLDGVLIPVEFLVNHRSILWDDRAQEVAVFHLELDEHDVLLANGAAAESYRDDGNRWLFENANTGWGLPPKLPCAPVLTGGEVVDTVWRRLLDRAGLRPGLPLIDDPDLHLVADGVRLDAVSRADGYHVFRLSSPPADARLVSHAVVPQEVGLARDPRSLGVGVSRIMVRQGTRVRAVQARDASLAEGFHPFEDAMGFRWTDGDARLPAAAFAGFAGPLEVVVQVASTTRYIADPARMRAA